MYKIPSDIEIERLKSETISQISFGLNIISLFFSKGSIQFSGAFSIYYEKKIHKYEEVCPVMDDFGLLKLLEKKIVNVSLNIERTSLALEFEGDIILNLLSNEMYESFEINLDGRRVIV